MRARLIKKGTPVPAVPPPSSKPRVALDVRETINAASDRHAQELALVAEFRRSGRLPSRESLKGNR